MVDMRPLTYQEVIAGRGALKSAADRADEW
jgi:hypothetical protein